MVLGANRLEPRSWPTSVDPGLCFSLFAISQSTDKSEFQLIWVKLEDTTHATNVTDFVIL